MSDAPATVVVYRRATDEELKDKGLNPDYDWLLGPNGFECFLGEPEDCRWCRDGKPVVEELNRLHSALDTAAKEEFRHKGKWREYERDYILPCFKWAEEVGFDLHAAVEKSPGKNCVHLLVEHLRGLAAAAKQSCEWELRDDAIYFAPCGFWSYEPAAELKCPCCRCKATVTVKVTGAES